MHAITLQEATAHISSVFSDVIHGEEIVITDREKPVLKMTPLIQDDPPRPQFGFLKGFFAVPDDFNEPLEDFKDYM